MHLNESLWRWIVVRVDAGEEEDIPLQRVADLGGREMMEFMEDSVMIRLMTAGLNLAAETAICR